MAQALIFLAPGFEEIEMLTVVDILRRGKVDVSMVSITDSLQVTSSHNVTITADLLFQEADFDQAKMIILPGGIPGTPNLMAYAPLVEQIKKFAAEGKLLSAICAAPTIYAKLGLLQGHKATCHPSQIENLVDTTYVEQPVVEDGIFTTSRGMGTTIPFAKAILARLADEATVDHVMKGIVYAS